jgi:hypothetical protein
MRRYDTLVTGGCQCGAVRYRATAMLDNAHICHCRMCQKATGNLFAALVAAPDDALSWVKGQPSLFRSSSEAERGFCAACGTPLFYRGNAGRTNLTIGSLDHPRDFPIKSQCGTEGLVMPLAELSTIADAGETRSESDPRWIERIAMSNRQHPDAES